MISGGTASVVFAGSGMNTLTLKTGSALSGAAFGSTASGATTALVLAGAGVANNNFDNFNTLTVKASRTWTLGGDSAIGATKMSTGALDVAGDLTTSLAQSAGTTLSIASGGELTTIGTTTVSDLTIGGAAEWDNEGTASQSGGNVQVGDAGGVAALLDNAAKHTYDILDDSGIGLGASALSDIVNAGTFEKTSGTATSVVAPSIDNTGTIKVSSGTLDNLGRFDARVRLDAGCYPDDRLLRERRDARPDRSPGLCRLADQRLRGDRHDRSLGRLDLSQVQRDAKECDGVCRGLYCADPARVGHRARTARDEDADVGAADDPPALVVDHAA